MNSRTQDVLKELLTGQRVMALGVLVDGAPYVGMLPFALHPGYTALLVQASDLARHSRGLADGARFSALIQEPDQPGLNPAELQRITLEGTVRRLERGSVEYATARDVYEKKFPESKRLFQMGDFNLYQLEIERGRLVAGFGDVHNVTRDELARIGEHEQPE